VSVKTRPQVPGESRLRGTLVSSDDDGFALAVEGSGDGPIRLAYGDVDRVRTVFVWGGQDTPGKPAPKQKPGQKKQQTTQKRKQVATP